MKPYRLLVDWEVIGKLQQLPRSTRQKLRLVLARLAATPDLLSDYREPNPRGIPLDSSTPS